MSKLAFLVHRLVPIVATVSQSCGDAQICRRMVDDNRDDEQAPAG
jgi:hypothetical protein